MKYKILSLDVWDTIIRRRCAPDEIKVMTANYLIVTSYGALKPEYQDEDKLLKLRLDIESGIGREHEEQGYDLEYEIHEVLERLIKKSFIDVENVDINVLVEKLYRYELDNEKKSSYLDPTIVEKINSIEHDKLVIVSDFYGGVDFLKELFDTIHFPFSIDTEYISCEYYRNKKTGNLFKVMLDKEGVMPSECIHLGDNEYSDVIVPRKIGMESERYLPREENELRKKRENEFLERKEETMSGNFKTKNASSLFFYMFIRWIVENCRLEEIRDIYFFTREGEFYKQIFEEYKKVNPDIAMNAHVLEVSRVATFFASMREITLDECMRVWNQYSIQPMAAFFKSLGLNVSDFKDFLDAYKITADEVIKYPWLDSRIINLFNDSLFIKKMTKERDDKRKLVKKYLQGKGLADDVGRKIAIVDIGWRGTIQDNIAYLLPEYKIEGYYIGLIPFLNKQPVNVSKKGFLNGYKDFGVIMKNVAPFEMLCNSPNGSTIGYKIMGGDVTAIRKKEEAEDRVYYKYIQNMQSDILRDVVAINCALGRKKVSAKWMEAAHEKLAIYIMMPPKKAAQAFFELKHNEEFGVGEYVDKSTKLRLDLFVKALFSAKGREKLKTFLSDTTWPQGYLVKYNMRLLCKIYNQMSKKRLENK